MADKLWAIGLMSGTSLDGVDAALILTDGETVHERGEWISHPYPDAFQEGLHHAVQQSGDIAYVRNELTYYHVKAVEALLEKSSKKAEEIALVGFHGQTIDHRPDQGITWQIGNPAMLAQKTGIEVVFDFRSSDIIAGGQGAPLVPIYHAALVSDMDKPVAVMNVGGVANVTWVGEGEHDIIAFDTGPGNALVNDLVLQKTSAMYDKDGELASKGTVQEDILEGYLYDNYFDKTPPKSLDRNEYSLMQVLHLPVEDAAATLTAFTARTIAMAAKHFPVPPKQWIISGGGRHNPALMKMLCELLDHVVTTEDVGWEGDVVEAQAFAYLAVRAKRRLPLTLTQTTGAAQAISGGAFYPV